MYQILNDNNDEGHRYKKNIIHQSAKIQACSKFEGLLHKIKKKFLLNISTFPFQVQGRVEEDSTFCINHLWTHHSSVKCLSPQKWSES
jgi:hypothetical protein